MPRSMPGHGFLRTRYPAEAGSPRSFTMSASMPGNGNVAEPGLHTVWPGSGVMRMCPVSVCHHVSTTGQRPPPMTFQYQTHASGLMGSPTLPRSRSDDRSQRAGYSSPHRTNVRMAMGAVYRMLTPYFSMMRQKRSLSGQSGVPSYMTTVAPLDSG